jgi:anaerobic magnesium-protoporphyrin IX monomethyl ester cyclase
MAKILFVQEEHWQRLGIMYLSGTLKKQGHQVDLAISADYKDVKSALIKFKPDAVGFSIMTGDHHWAADMASKIKIDFDVKTIFGGPHCTFFPEFLSHEAVDFIVRGEGEQACLQFMNCLQDETGFSSVPNLSFKSNGEIIENDMGQLDDIDLIEFPDREIYAKHKDEVDFSVVYVLTSRGCPYKCTFCFEEEQQKLFKGLGNYVRIRTPENIFAEINSAVAEKFEFGHVMFIDDVFGLNKVWLYDFLEKYKKEVNLPFISVLRADLISNNEEYAKRLADAGGIGCSFGIESGREHLRQLSLQKRLTDYQIIDASEKLRKVGIKFKTFNIFGFPGESVEDAFSTVELNMKIKADFPQSNLFIPFPKTGLAEYAMEKGYLSKKFSADDIRTDAFIHSALKSPYTKQFERINKLFQTAVTFPFLWPLIKKYVRMDRDSKFFDFVADIWFGIVYFLLYWKSSKRNIVKLVAFALRRFRQTLGLIPTETPESRRFKMMYPPASSKTENQSRNQDGLNGKPAAYRERVVARRKEWMEQVASIDKVKDLAAGIMNNELPSNKSDSLMDAIKLDRVKSS